jgi:predicted nucleic acid-binding protein
MSTFIDSSVWFAAATKNDRSNERAKSILSSVRRPITTDQVLAETWMLLAKRFGHQIGDLFWERLRHAGIRAEPIKEADLELAWQIGNRFPDVSFVDRTSFAFMELRGLVQVAALTDTFSKHRYGPRLERSFRILDKGYSGAFNSLCQAAREHRTVRLTYKDREQIASPHIVGETTGEERALVLLRDGAWLCLRLAHVANVDFTHEPWLTADYPGRVQRCVDKVVVDCAKPT